MNIRDLGTLDQPVLLFGGVYSNLEALSELEALADAGDVPVARRICTGDLVAYCADPRAVMDRFLHAAYPIVAGNCERQIAADADDCGCGFDAGSTCSILSMAWYSHARAALDAAHRAFCADVPDILTFRHCGKRFAVIHGGVTDIARFLWPVSDAADFAAEIKILTDAVGPVDAVVAGHSGVAFLRRIGGVGWINAGAIGMTDNTGDPRTAYVLLQDGRAEIRRLDYDHVSARRAMIAAGLTQGYHEALVTGHWPSEDVLPDVMRRDYPGSGPALETVMQL